MLVDELEPNDADTYVTSSRTLPHKVSNQYAGPFEVPALRQ